MSTKRIAAMVSCLGATLVILVGCSQAKALFGSVCPHQCKNQDLSKRDLSGVDLSEADLNGALYSDGTTWSSGFDPEGTGARWAEFPGSQ